MANDIEYSLRIRFDIILTLLFVVSEVMDMKTNILQVLNLCVPYHNYCRYCLLSWDGKCLDIDDRRAMQYAKRIFEWIKK